MKNRMVYKGLYIDMDMADGIDMDDIDMVDERRKMDMDMVDEMDMDVGRWVW